MLGRASSSPAGCLGNTAKRLQGPQPDATPRQTARPPLPPTPPAAVLPGEGALARASVSPGPGPSLGDPRRPPLGASVLPGGTHAGVRGWASRVHQGGRRPSFDGARWSRNTHRGLGVLRVGMGSLRAPFSHGHSGTPWTATARSQARLRLSAADPPRLRPGVGAGPGLLAPPPRAHPRRPPPLPAHRRVPYGEEAGRGSLLSQRRARELPPPGMGRRAVSQPTGWCRPESRLSSASGAPPEARVSETEPETFGEGLCSASRVILQPGAVPGGNLEQAWVWGPCHLGPRSSLLSRGRVHTRGKGAAVINPGYPTTTLTTC